MRGFLTSRSIFTWFTWITFTRTIESRVMFREGWVVSRTLKKRYNEKCWKKVLMLIVRHGLCSEVVDISTASIGKFQECAWLGRKGRNANLLQQTKRWMTVMSHPLQLCCVLSWWSKAAGCMSFSCCLVVVVFRECREVRELIKINKSFLSTWFHVRNGMKWMFSCSFYGKLWVTYVSFWIEEILKMVLGILIYKLL